MPHHKRIISGIQATGRIHLGNYLGAIRNWLSPTHNIHECFFFIADLHALTVDTDPTTLQFNARFLLATYIACGIDPHKHVLFQQSHVAEHTELYWLLGCHTPLGWLNRMTQFKDKAGKNKEVANLGLYAYPVLMAADILLYRADAVPVGDDQKQHLELTRDIAQSINHHYDAPVFTVPEPLIVAQGARIMSLRDGTKKMSKSDPSELSRILLNDTDEAIAVKIRKAKSDAFPFPGTIVEAQERPEAFNLGQIYSALTNQSLAHVCALWAGKEFSVIKKELIDSCCATIGPIREKIALLMENRDYLDDILRKNAHRAKEIAHVTLASYKHCLGLGI
ncbi:MAG: tryptophan--tRNA ligase [Alphaproteobacteria bacterium]|nr:MAG: tryptophan--tRNA ligase [Alphaproteobacteria bacterium]